MIRLSIQTVLLVFFVMACGVAQGLAFGLDVPVAPISTLAALALASGERHVWTCLDARIAGDAQMVT